MKGGFHEEENSKYGFEYGAASIERVLSDKKEGYVVIGIDTPKQGIQVYVTKTGKIRVYGDVEWLPIKRKGDKQDAKII